MAREQKIVGVIEDGGEVSWHISDCGSGAYLTLCGLDGNDSAASQHGTVAPRRGQKITCPQCYCIWKGVVSLKLRRANFAEGLC